jgi:hypothetical protein
MRVLSPSRIFLKAVIASFFAWSLAILILVQACDNEISSQKTVKEQQVRQEQLAQDKTKLENFIALKEAYDADASWDKNLSITSWTVDLQARIVGRAIVSSAVLVDVYLGRDGKEHLHLIKGDFFGPRFDFFLTCPKPERLPANFTGFPEYFFAAKIQSVQKDARYNSSELATGFTTEGPHFVLGGECLELRLNQEKMKKAEEAAKSYNQGLRPGSQKYGTGD